jgi:hypothetical protein
VRATDIPVGSKVQLRSRRGGRSIEGTYKGWGWDDRNAIHPVFYLVAVTQTVIAYRCAEFDIRILP